MSAGATPRDPEPGPPELVGVPLGWIPAAAAPVWLLLTGLMLGAAWSASRAGIGDGRMWGGAVLALVVLCWLHPIYTAAADGFGKRRAAELGGSVVTLLVATPLTLALLSTSPLAAALLVPVLVWLSVATYYLAVLFRRESGS